MVKDWYDSTRTSQIPKAGAIAYFATGSNEHYVFVEYVYDDIIIFSEANYTVGMDFQYQMATIDQFVSRSPNKKFKGYFY